MFTSALWALLRSEGLGRGGWSIGCRLLLGLMVLSRSMTIAFLPGFAIAAVLPLALSPVDRKRRMLNFALLCVCGEALAALWYAPNLYSVGSYLLNFGYGAELKVAVTLVDPPETSRQVPKAVFPSADVNAG